MSEMEFSFQKATKYASRLRLAIVGPAGSGKTYSGLRVGTALARIYKTRLAVIDSERGSAAKYADIFDFDVLPLRTHAPETYVKAIAAAEKEHGVVLIDSLSHAWIGKEGALEQVDSHARRDRGDSFGAWRHVTPQHNAMVDAILNSSAHVIATMRTKTEYVREKDEKTGKTVVRKIGLAPVQRDGLEYEFDVVGDIDYENFYSITKTRISSLSEKVIKKPDEGFAAVLADWLAGAEAPPPPPKPVEEDPLARQVANPRIKELFDQLGATDAKRLASMNKYRDDTKLVEVLEGKVKEAMASKEAAAPESAPGGSQ